MVSGSTAELASRAGALRFRVDTGERAVRVAAGAEVAGARVAVVADLCDSEAEVVEEEEAACRADARVERVALEEGMSIWLNVERPQHCLFVPTTSEP